MNVVCKVRVLPRIGPSGVRALPLAAGINVGGHYWSEGSACAALGCWHKRKWPLFLIFWSDMCAKKFPLVSMRGRAEGLVCADLGARTPIGASGI